MTINCCQHVSLAMIFCQSFGVMLFTVMIVGSQVEPEGRSEKG